MTDVSDHLPVFAVLDQKPEASLALKVELTNHDCQEVYVEAIDDSYKAFFHTFVTVLDQQCQSIQSI